MEIKHIKDYDYPIDQLKIDDVFNALAKLDSNDGDSIDRMATKLEAEIKYLNSYKTTKPGFGSASAYELLAKLGIWLVLNNIYELP